MKKMRKINVKMAVILAICALFAVSLFACGTGSTDNTSARTGNGQVNTNNGSADGGTGDYYRDNNDMGIDGAVGDAIDGARNAVDSAANSVENNMGINSRSAGGNTTANF